MKVKQILVVVSANIAFLNALDMPPMMPTLTPKAKIQQKVVKKTVLPSSCQMVPPMMFRLPPPMESEVVKCKNVLQKPTLSKVEKELSKYLKKNIKVQKVEIVKNFSQLYKITYSQGTILTNSSVNTFIEIK